MLIRYRYLRFQIMFSSLPNAESAKLDPQVPGGAMTDYQVVKLTSRLRHC